MDWNWVTSFVEAVLLGIVLFLQNKNKKEVNAIAHNHLSGLPEILDTLQRIERQLVGFETYVKVRLNHIDRE